MMGGSSGLTKSDFVKARRGDKEFWSRMTDIKNVTNTDISPGDIVTDSTHRFVTDAEISTWNSGPGGAATIPFLAATDISAFDVVTSDGKIGDSTVSNQRGKVIGINSADVLTRFMGAAIGFGTASNPAWAWTIGDKIYLNGTHLSTTAPGSGYCQFIGTAISATDIDVKLGEPILL